MDNLNMTACEECGVDIDLLDEDSFHADDSGYYCEECHAGYEMEQMALYANAPAIPAGASVAAYWDAYGAHYKNPAYLDSILD